MQYLLGIESSCDDTGVALASIEDDGQISIVAEALSSQVEMHKLYGGVVPELAAREHLRNLPLLIEEVLASAKVGVGDLAAVGVTRGPGLKGCLLVGLNFAKALALAQGIPLIAVNHIEAHIFAAQLDHPELEPPFLALVVSGGHTEIHLVKGLRDYQLIARTVDDAAGEAFDKSANLLGIGYPGGPALARLADSVDKSPFRLPRVMRQSEGFSFSGLKTAIAMLIKQQPSLEEEGLRAALAFAIQEAIVDALLFKLKKAVKQTNQRKVVVTGGVSANHYLRKRLAGWSQITPYFPRIEHCLDNGANSAYLAAKQFRLGLATALNATALARWPIESLLCE